MRIYQWFVGLTGIVNLVGGIVLVSIASTPMIALLASKPAVYVLAGFLSFSGIALVWAAQNLQERAPIVFWEGILRLWAAGTFLAMPQWPNAHLVVLGDGSIGLCYIVGLFVVARVPLAAALTGKRESITRSG